MSTPQWLNDKEVSRMTGRGLQTLRNDRHLCRGIPYSLVGRRSIRYRLDDVVSYMESRKVIPIAA